jgi:hypothetical protein
MISIFPSINIPESSCVCGGAMAPKTDNLLWQGAHICADVKCVKCGLEYYIDLPVGQAKVTPFTYDKKIKKVLGNEGGHWFAKLMRNFADPVTRDVKITIESLRPAKEVIILNTLDFCYGHSLLFLFNLNNILAQQDNFNVIVIIQPMFRWLVPEDSRICEVWTVYLKLSEGYNYYPQLSERLNNEIRRFEKVSLSSAHLLPHKIGIVKYTRVKPFEFNSNRSQGSRITFIWRQDSGRLWVKNRYFNYACRRIGVSRILRWIQLRKINRFFSLLQGRLGNQYDYSVAGLGTYGTFSSFIQDLRVDGFNDQNEKATCAVYAESLLVIGVHGSSMILPSAHAGMAISIMPEKRWGNYLEDLLVNEADERLAMYQKRVVPMRLRMDELLDITTEMVNGRELFVKKFLYAKEEL